MAFHYASYGKGQHLLGKEDPTFGCFGGLARSWKQSAHPQELARSVELVVQRRPARSVYAHDFRLPVLPGDGSDRIAGNPWTIEEIRAVTGRDDLNRLARFAYRI